ncbi:cupin domain-containing protein [Gracilimonas sp. Q87]|uniref:cupin domain-containing protein n=1 Tax=Gracilimonas sp. Q87 TaxID=3384766 RepID=UPI0039840491
MKECSTYLFEDDGSIPNNPNLPLLVYLDALDPGQRGAETCKHLLEDNGWRNAWVNGIYSYHHYHSTTHEVLAVISGSAKVKMGGDKGEEISISEGDVIVIPAGVGHCRLSSSDDFQVVGAYPGGRSYDLCTGKKSERPQVLENIKNVPLPEQDPVTGEKEPLYKYWEN